MQRLISFLLFFILFGIGILQAQNRTSIRINENKLDGFADTTFQAMRYHVGQMPYYKGMKVYADRNLEKMYTAKELAGLYNSCETVIIPNPANPDDPYDLIDTSICLPFDPGLINGWVLHTGKDKYRRNQWKEVTSVCVAYNSDKITDTFSYYYKAADVSKYLTDAEKRFLNAYIPFDDPFIRDADMVIMSDSSVKKFIAAWYDSVSAYIYTNIQKGKITAYNSDSLKYTITPIDLEKLGGYCITMQFPNPKNPDDPYDLIDSTYCTRFMPEDLLGFSACYDWKLGQINSQSTLHAVGLLFKQNMGNLELAARPMFYLKAEEVKKLLPEADWLLMNDILNFGLLSSVDNGYYLR